MPLPQQPVYGSSLASISPQVPVSQVGSWPLVLLPLYFFQETKFVKSISSDSGIRTIFSSFCLSTGNYMACSVWSNLIVLPFAHSTQSVSSGWVFFWFLFFLHPEYNETAVLAGRRRYLDRWTYSSWNSVPSHHIHLQSDPASVECHGTTDQERKNYHKSRSIYLPFLSWSLLFPMASLHIDQVTLANILILIVLCVNVHLP